MNKPINPLLRNLLAVSLSSLLLSACGSDSKPNITIDNTDGKESPNKDDGNTNDQSNNGNTDGQSNNGQNKDGQSNDQSNNGKNKDGQSNNGQNQNNTGKKDNRANKGNIGLFALISESYIDKYENGGYAVDKFGNYSCSEMEMKPGEKCGLLQYTVTGEFGKLAKVSPDTPVTIEYELVSSTGDISNILKNPSTRKGTVTLHKNNIQEALNFPLKTDNANTGNWSIKLVLSNPAGGGNIDNLNTAILATTVIDVQSSNGNSTVPPSNGNSNVPPKNGNGSVPPKSGNGNVPPKNGNSNVPPKSGNGNVPPKNGNSNVPPKNGNGNVPPNNGMSATIGGINDTGVSFSGDKVKGNETSCAVSPTGKQDCAVGRDAMYRDDSDGMAGFSFTKLDASGKALPTMATEWHCVKDNVTGNIWERKTFTPEIEGKYGAEAKANKDYRDDAWDYTYYDAALALGSATNGNKDCKLGDTTCNTANYIAKMNSDAVCGISTWRLPTRIEMLDMANLGGNDGYQTLHADWLFSKNGSNDDREWKNYHIPTSFWTSSVAAKFDSHDGYSQPSTVKFNNIWVMFPDGSLATEDPSSSYSTAAILAVSSAQ